LGILIKSFFGIIRVQVDTAAGIISIKRFFSEEKKSLHEISGYYRSIYTRNYRTNYLGRYTSISRGLILKTVTGESLNLAEDNLKSISDLQKYLEEKKVDFLGEKETKAFIYF
jgi:hypothetical protein